MRLGRSCKNGLIVVACLVVLGAGFLWALPEIVRRVALDQIPKRTGRAATIEDVDLNLFTGHLAIKKFRLADRRGSDVFVEFDVLDVTLALRSLIHSDVRLNVNLDAPTVRVSRASSGELNFSDLLQPKSEAPPPEKPPAKPSRWTVTVDRLTLSRGTIRVHDEAVSPAADWVMQDLGVDVAEITTRKDATPGRLNIRAKINEAALAVTSEPLRLDPLKVEAKVTLDGFEVTRLNPYVFVPIGAAYRPAAGRFNAALAAMVDNDGEEVKKLAVSGTVSLDGSKVVLTGPKQDPFSSSSRLAVQVKEADLIERTLIVASVVVEGLDLKVRRDAKGTIDIVEALTATPTRAPPSAPKAAAPASAPPPERKLFPVLQSLTEGFKQITVERITLAPSQAKFVDEAVKPVTTLALSKLQATLTGVTWPPKGPANLTLSTGLPGGGTLEVKGPVVPQPLDADLAFTLRNAPVEPYQAYIPVPALLKGRFNGDSRNRIAMKDGTMLLASKGNSWGQNVEIWEPGAKRPVIRVERMDLTGIDFDWPKRAAVARAGFRKPSVEIERLEDGSFSIRRLFTPANQNGQPAAPPPASSTPAAQAKPSGDAKQKDLLETMQLDFKEVRVEQGFVRFIDRSTKPAFSQDLSRLEVTVNDFNNRPGERARVAVQSVVGGDAALDIRGEISSLGSPAFVDLVGELRSFKLAAVDPYAAPAIGWIIKKGELQYKVHLKLDGDMLDATNEVVVAKLQVAPSSGADEVKQRIGLPLGLIVALIKDSKGEIHANVPITGSTKDPKFDLRDTIWTAVKNVLLNIVKAPFRAISSLFSGKGGDTVEEPKVDPVTFAAGSAVLSPEMEEHLVRVADFMRRTPYVSLALASPPSSADAEALKVEVVSTRLNEFQKEKGLKEGPDAVAAYFKAQLPDVPLPATTEEQLAALRERESVGDDALADLAHRRVEATRDRLVQVEGIQADRLTVAEPKESRESKEPKESGDAKTEANGASASPPAKEGDMGRVEFAIVAGAE